MKNKIKHHQHDYAEHVEEIKLGPAWTSEANGGVQYLYRCSRCPMKVQSSLPLSADRLRELSLMDNHVDPVDKIEK